MNLFEITEDELEAEARAHLSARAQQRAQTDRRLALKERELREKKKQRRLQAKFLKYKEQVRKQKEQEKQNANKAQIEASRKAEIQGILSKKQGIDSGESDLDAGDKMLSNALLAGKAIATSIKHNIQDRRERKKEEAAASSTPDSGSTTAARTNAPTSPTTSRTSPPSAGSRLVSRVASKMPLGIKAVYEPESRSRFLKLQARRKREAQRKAEDKRQQKTQDSEERFDDWMHYRHVVGRAKKIRSIRNRKKIKAILGSLKSPRLRLGDSNVEPGNQPNLNDQFEYSCWREEFIYEMGNLRRKSRTRDDDSPVDVKKSRTPNRVTLFPKVSNESTFYGELLETTNGASIFAKATPPLKRRTTPMSDIHLSNQPGKGSAERVEKLMRKLFLGDRSNFYPNYDLSGHKADDNDLPGGRSASQTNEAYDEDNETFRQHSRERFTAGVGDGTRARRTAGVLKKIAAMNQDVPTPKKKKKKKKKEGQV